MDEMNVKLSTKIMRGMVAKLIARAVFKKTGHTIEVQLNEIELKTYDGKVHLHMNVNVESESDEFLEIVKTIGLD